MAASLVVLVSALVGLAAMALTVRLLWRDLPRSSFVLATVYLGLAAGVGAVAWRLRGFTWTSFLAALALAYVALLAGTWGHPSTMFEIWLKDSSLTRRQSFFFQLRFIVLFLVIVGTAAFVVIAYDPSLVTGRT